MGGIYAAVLTPRNSTGDLDEAGFARMLEWLIGKGVDGFAIHGATGEFTRTTEDEFARLMRVASEVLRDRVPFLAGVGAASVDACVCMARMAERAGAEALLLPMPWFFRYSQHDLKAFCCAVANAVETPVLLYNLPQFTNGLEPQTSAELIAECRGIIGIKDSSGLLETVRLLTQRKIAARRLIGNDAVLAAAIEESVLDGVVSGVACVLPELIMQLYQAGIGDTTCAEFHELRAVLAEVVARLDALPAPWGLKMLAEARGLGFATYPMPLAHGRELERDALLEWFSANRARLLAE
ncbi:MAG TPA: dihydrodipicolinate synthase family protein [Acidobacteriaceae bacterium]|nr:dihydrodipicolinate synthase family protein [Acidobacteriaceae bacterium]